MPRSLINAISICLGVLLTSYALMSTLFLVNEHASAAFGSVSPLNVVSTIDSNREPEAIDKSEPGIIPLLLKNTRPEDTNLRSSIKTKRQLTAPHSGGSIHERLTPRLSESDSLEPEIPMRIVVPAIDLDAPVVPVTPVAEKLVTQDQPKLQTGQVYLQWPVPDFFAAGWHADSARLGEAGNTVLNGHHNISGKVFGRLVDLEPGEMILVYSDDSLFTFQITNKMILPEKYEEIDIRMTNARWISPSQDERLTLITCWPEQSNSHRLIIVAKPSGRLKLNSPEKPAAAYK